MPNYTILILWYLRIGIRSRESSFFRRYATLFLFFGVKKTNIRIFYFFLYHFQQHPGILVEYNGSLAAALLDVFPEIGLDRSSFNFLQSMLLLDQYFNLFIHHYFCTFKITVLFILPLFFVETHWNDVQNRRNFFLEISRRLNFDPLVANNWYSNCTAIKQSKVHI